MLKDSKSSFFEQFAQYIEYDVNTANSNVFTFNNQLLIKMPPAYDEGEREKERSMIMNVVYERQIKRALNMADPFKTNLDVSMEMFVISGSNQNELIDYCSL